MTPRKSVWSIRVMPFHSPLCARPGGATRLSGVKFLPPDFFLALFCQPLHPGGRGALDWMRWRGDRSKRRFDIDPGPTARSRFREKISPRNVRFQASSPCMKKSDVQCPYCGAGYRRIELTSVRSQPGSYRCLVCKRVMEIFNGSTEVAYRLTVAPVRVAGTSGLQDDP